MIDVNIKAKDTCKNTQLNKSKPKEEKKVVDTRHSLKTIVFENNLDGLSLKTKQLKSNNLQK